MGQKSHTWAPLTRKSTNQNHQPASLGLRWIAFYLVDKSFLRGDITNRPRM
jgi:hypothetical protein